jgi:hypothetical protein
MAPTPHEVSALPLWAALGTAAIVSITSLVGAAAAAPETQVQTTDGALTGLWQPGYRLFQGIPYAEPPVGKLRWQPPQAVQPWTGVRPALQPGRRVRAAGDLLETRDAGELA